MTLGRTLRDELDEIREELLRLGRGGATAEATGAPATPLQEQIAELNGMVQQMLADAEEMVAEHPIATVAGALALGIVIGRLTAH